jgi:hypothetical protein
MIQSFSEVHKHGMTIHFPSVHTKVVNIAAHLLRERYPVGKADLNFKMVELLG